MLVVLPANDPSLPVGPLGPIGGAVVSGTGRITGTIVRRYRPLPNQAAFAARMGIHADAWVEVATTDRKGKTHANQTPDRIGAWKPARPFDAAPKTYNLPPMPATRCNHREDGMNQIDVGGVCLVCCQPVGKCPSCPAWFHFVDDRKEHQRLIHGA